MPGPWNITFENNSDNDLTLVDDWLVKFNVSWPDSFTTLPTKTMQKYMGGTSMGVVDSFPHVPFTEYIQFGCGWASSNENAMWGVIIYIPPQFVAGYAPYYQVAENCGSVPKWYTPVSNPADPFSFFPQNDTKVTVTPSATGSTLSLQVTIEPSKISN